MLDQTNGRTYCQSHPWIDFNVDLKRADIRLWMMFGEAQSKCEHIAGVPLRPDQAQQLYHVYLVKGVHATTSIEGNTLTAEQVDQHIAGKLKLPESQAYLGTELDNVVDACNRIAKEMIGDPSAPITAARICDFNRMVLQDLEVEEHVRPGETRKVSVGVLRYRGAPWEDCDYLLERLCNWLNSAAFEAPSEELRFTYTLLKAILAHLYIAWIHPFGDGNGRTARLIEFQILMQSGLVPFPACHLLSNHYNMTRNRYYLELDKANKPSVGIEPFIEYTVAGFLDGLREQLTYIRKLQWEVAWENYVHAKFRGKDTASSNRQKHLVLDMPDQPTELRGLTLVTPRVAKSYAKRGERALSRDLDVLRSMGLITRESKGYVPNRGIILAFLPPKCPVRETIKSEEPVS